MNHALTLHKHCAVCASEQQNPYSLGVEYQLSEENLVFAQFTPQVRHMGYQGLLHGGIASALLDGAMTHCLLLQNIPALTARLDVRYHEPIAIGEQVMIFARCDAHRRGIYQLSAELCVQGKVHVSASGKFIVPKTQN